MELQELLDLLGPLATERRVEAGARVVEQGASVSEVLFVADGEVTLVLSGIPPVVLGRRGPGEAVTGEWVVSKQTAPCDVVAGCDTRLLALSEDSLYEAFAESRRFARHFLERTLHGAVAVQQVASQMYVRSNRLEAQIARQVDGEYGDLVGPSRPMAELRKAVQIHADTADPLLLVGEAGVGKELVAATIHLSGPRRNEPLVTMRGAEWRTDLWQERMEIATGGTILIFEVDGLPPEALPAVTALCKRLGPDRPRLIGTITETPGQKARRTSPWDGTPVLRIPPLRERKADIPDLARAFLRDLNAIYGVTDDPISSEAMRLLIAYPYLSRNVTELRDVITHAAHLAVGGVIRPEHLRLGQHSARPGRPVVGVALGGGVVRGMAHIGVLQVLQEEGIHIDLVAGTSVGSLVGAVFAGGCDLRELERLAPTLSWPKLVGPVWPKDGMLSNAKLGAFVDKLIGAKNIEELPIPYAAVSVCRITGEEVILRDGPVGTAVRASTAIPGLFAPIDRDKRQLIDGGLVNNVPASVVRSMGADVVIGVDVRDYNYFNPGKDGGLLMSLLRGYDIMIHRAAQSELEWADVPVFATREGVNPYGFKMAGELVEAGREQARLAIPAIRAAIHRAEVKAG